MTRYHEEQGLVNLHIGLRNILYVDTNVFTITEHKDENRQKWSKTKQDSHKSPDKRSDSNIPKIVSHVVVPRLIVSYRWNDSCRNITDS